jgi:hypothetical protein
MKPVVASGRGSAAPGPRDAAEARYARRVAHQLSAAAGALDPAVADRLQAARRRALAAARTRAAAASAAAGGTLALVGAPGEGGGRWFRLASLVPLLLVLAGIALIDRLVHQNQIRAAAEIDAALLADDLPPAAYSDPGFRQFLLKAPSYGAERAVIDP